MLNMDELRLCPDPSASSAGPAASAGQRREPEHHEPGQGRWAAAAGKSGGWKREQRRHGVDLKLVELSLRKTGGKKKTLSGT